MDNLSGQTIKGFHLLERVGAGGFGAVYRARQTVVDREVAVKIILPVYADQPEFIRRFEIEAQTIARLEHPHIIPIYDFWRDSSGAYLIMRWMRGGSLGNALKHGPYTIEDTARLIDQIASALTLAHRSEIVHRDIKPDNILLDEEGNAYLADFGLAKLLASAEQNLTKEGAVIGSPAYLSPEHLRGEPVSPRSDIYSLGIMLYEMLVGEHPFVAESTVQRLFKHLNEPVPRIALTDMAIAESLNEVIQCATAKDPEHRYSDIQTLALALRDACALGASRDTQMMVALLTPREQAVLKMIIEGRSNREIADQLVVELTTVKWYITQIYKKLNVRSRVQAIIKARELNLIVDNWTDTMRLAAESLAALPENPYKGLRAFQAADAQDFYGRENLTAHLVGKLDEKGPFSRFLSIVGPSGSGKSSLVKAGLIPAVWRGGLPGSDQWFIAEMVPGAHPLDELEVALTRVAAVRDIDIHEHLERNDRGLQRVTQMILPGVDSELLLVIDQFEEVFTLVENETERRHFLDLITSAVTDSRSHVRVVITLRADYYDRPLHYPELGELIRSRSETILPLSPAEMERAISKPAENVGVRFENGLVASIISVFNYKPGALPLLQYALTELFDKQSDMVLTHAAYDEIGGAAGALARRAETLFGELDNEGQAVARQMFLRLVTLGEGAEDTRRRVTRSELLGLTAQQDLMEEIIDSFAAYRLLSLDRDAEKREPTVELAHEAIIREWERLREWLNQSRQEIRVLRQVGAMAAEWQTANNDPSYLASGARLEQLESWARATGLGLTELEKQFLMESLARRGHEQALEASRQAREAGIENRRRQLARWLIAALSAGLLVATILSIYAFEQQQAAQSERDTARSLSLASASRAALGDQDTDLALTLAMAANQGDEPPALSQRALYDAAFAPGGTQLVFRGHQNPVYRVAVSPDGKLALSGGVDGDTILWKIQTGQEVRRLKTAPEGPDKRWVSGLVFIHNGDAALTATDGSDTLHGQIILWDLNTGERLHEFMLPDHEILAPVFALAVSPDEKTMITGGHDDRIMVWNIGTGQLLRVIDIYSDPQGQADTSPDKPEVNALAFIPGSNTALSGDTQGNIDQWDLATGVKIRHFSGTHGWVEVMVSPDGRLAYSSGDNGEILVWDIGTGQVEHDYSMANITVSAIALNRDGKSMFIGSANGTLLQLDLASGQTVRRFFGHARAINWIELVPDDSRLLTASNDNTVRVAALASGAVDLAVQLPIPAGLGNKIPPTGGVAFSPQGDRAAISTTNGLVIWLISPPLVASSGLLYLEDAEQIYPEVRFSPDGKLILAVSDNSFTLWDSQSGRQILSVTGPTDQFSAAAFSPDGTMIATTEQDHSVEALDAHTEVLLWGVKSGKIIHRIPVEGYGEGIAFSHDGRNLAVGTFPSTDILLFDVETGRLLGRLSGHEALVGALQFSVDGKQLMSGSWDSTMRLWDLSSGREARRFVGSSTQIFSVDFSNDLRMAYSLSSDGYVLLWNVQTGAILRRVGPVDVPDMRPSPDGRHIIVHTPGNLFEYVDLKPDLRELITWVKTNRLIRNLTCSERELYQVEPTCDSNSRTPTPTNAAQ